MLQLRFLDEADKDLRRIYAFLADVRPTSATQAIDAILEDIDMLLRHPEAGHVRDEARDYRKWVVIFGKNGYVIDYRVDDDYLYINRIWHSREARG